LCGDSSHQGVPELGHTCMLSPQSYLQYISDCPMITIWLKQPQPPKGQVLLRTSLSARLSFSDYWNSDVLLTLTIYSTDKLRPHTKIWTHSLYNEDYKRQYNARGPIARLHECKVQVVT